MRLSDLKALRERGQRPAAGLLLVRDTVTRSANALAARAELIVGSQDVRASWMPIAGLLVHFWPHRWEPWTLPLIERMQAAKPEVLTIADPVSGDIICVYAHGEVRPLACEADCDEAWLAAYKAVRRA